MRKHLIGLAFLFTLLVTVLCQAQSPNILWYKQAAKYFEESLVLGNGKVGASEVTMDWENKSVKKLTILAINSGKTTLYLSSEKKEINFKKKDRFLN